MVDGLNRCSYWIDDALRYFAHGVGILDPVEPGVANAASRQHLAPGSESASLLSSKRPRAPLNDLVSEQNDAIEHNCVP